ncbi:MAG: SCO family protein [Rickettsiales bacterium TMED289]|nr:MAG: SCO family protein [Rickettsiales bacterium TMED289]|tara:strand:- start:974 stop:1567 length:594 start_codon:yes stop_codon:yes gene_type:complete
MNSLNKKLAIAFLFIFMLGSFGLYIIDKAARSRIDNISILGQVPSFSLTNFDGSIITEEQLSDKISIVSFIFTQCEGACPIMSENMSTLQQRFALSDEIQFLSITTDPDFDSLEILSKYSSSYSNDDNWFFLRGDILDIIELSEKGFFLDAKLLPTGHSLNFVLVDKNLNIRKYYKGDEESNIFELQHDIVTLLEQG